MAIITGLVVFWGGVIAIAIYLNWWAGLGASAGLILGLVVVSEIIDEFTA